MTTTWSINTLERETADGFVYTVHYDVNATDGTYAARAYGTVCLENPVTLVPYADLTAETVIGWVKAKLNAENEKAVENIEAALAAQIAEQKTPTVGTGTPWS